MWLNLADRIHGSVLLMPVVLMHDFCMITIRHSFLVLGVGCGIEEGCKILFLFTCSDTFAAGCIV